MNSYKVKIINKASPFDSNSKFHSVLAGMSLAEAVNFSRSLNDSLKKEDKKIAIVEYDNTHNESDEVIKQKIIQDIGKSNLEKDQTLAVFKEDKLMLRAQDIAPVKFIPANPFDNEDANAAINDANAAINKAKEILEQDSVKLVTKNESGKQYKLIEYDIVTENEKVVAENLVHAESAKTIASALNFGEPINSPVILDALKIDRDYFDKINAKFEELAILLRENKQKTKKETAEEETIEMFQHIEDLAKRMAGGQQQVVAYSLATKL